MVVVYPDNALDDASVNSCELACDGDDKGPCDQTPVDEMRKERVTLACNENRAVMGMKILVFVVLLLTSALVSAGIYKYIRDDQMKAFQDAFDADAAKILEAFHHKLEKQIETLDGLSVAITSYALLTGSTFPNVTLPDFAARFANARVLSESFMITFNPLVTDATRAGWEEYSIQHLDHYYEALEEETMLRDHQDNLYHWNSSLGDLDVADRVPAPWMIRLGADGNFSRAELNSGPYHPIWHMSPVSPGPDVINIDTSTHPTFGGSTNRTMDLGLATIGNASYLVGKHLRGTGEYFTMLLALSQYRNDFEAYQGDPMSSFSYPVFDTLNVHTRKPVGCLGSVMYWRFLFKNVLPDDSRGIIAVLENTHGDVLTYRIHGPNVTFVDAGDLHDPKYDDMARKCGMISSYRTPMERRSLTSVDFDTEYNSYRLRIYPSQETENAFVTDDARMSSIVVLCVFMFTSIVFVLYTVAVARRQRVVMDRAVASSAIVSSLFPSQVRDQLYRESEINAEKKNPYAHRHKDSFSTEETEETADSRPIASVFENTTILFADMVGFTKWSSTREPVKVFELLETLYQSFDDIAVRRRVFKVETIGDCYVAVTGLPEPQENHAVIMVKFADDCMNKMKVLTAELAETLGADTATLTMRVGLHSGSVTGGVLRGQKSRFQLFGDTVNTASRMESNGVAGRIHVSQETMLELIAKGKSSWITPREDKIIAKGKGELQTYWVSPRSGSSSSDSGASNPGGELPGRVAGSDLPAVDAPSLDKSMFTI
jgi:class 3 adenylate cyclase